VHIIILLSLILFFQKVNFCLFHHMSYCFINIFLYSLFDR
jgi:hypothetical protein